MKKEFIPYEQALELKKLGFDEPCMAGYDKDFIDKLYIGFTENDGVLSFNAEYYILAPLYQQAFRWFRDKKLSDSCICRYQSRDDGGVYYYYVINHDFGIEETRHFEEGFFSYEEAELVCLKKLIELAKQK